MKRLFKHITAKLKAIKHFDKILHFLGSAVIAWFMGASPTFFMCVGIEIGDYKNYGHSTMKNGTPEAKTKYVQNTILDLMADVLGIAVALTIKAVLQ